MPDASDDGVDDVTNDSRIVARPAINFPVGVERFFLSTFRAIELAAGRDRHRFGKNAACGLTRASCVCSMLTLNVVRVVLPTPSWLEYSLVSGGGTSNDIANESGLFYRTATTVMMQPRNKAQPAMTRVTCICFSSSGGTDRRVRSMSGTSSGEKVKENADQSTSSTKCFT